MNSNNDPKPTKPEEGSTPTQETSSPAENAAQTTTTTAPEQNEDQNPVEMEQDDVEDVEENALNSGGFLDNASSDEQANVMDEEVSTTAAQSDPVNLNDAPPPPPPPLGDAPPPPLPERDAPLPPSESPATSTLMSEGEAPEETSRKRKHIDDESEKAEQDSREKFQKRNKEISDAAKKEEDENNRAREAAMYRASRGDEYAPFQKVEGRVGDAAMRTADDARLAESGLHVSLDIEEGKHRVHLVVKGNTIEVDDKDGNFASGEDYEKLCERIVDFARGEMGFTSVTLDWKNMKDITEEKIDKFLAAARERGLEVYPGAQIDAYMKSQQADGLWGKFKEHWGMNPNITPEERDARLIRMQQKFADHNNAVRAARNAPLTPEQEIVKQNIDNKFADKKIEVETRDNIDLSTKGRGDYRKKYLDADAAGQDVPKMMTEELNKIEGRVRRVESALSKLDDQLKHYQAITQNKDATTEELTDAQRMFKATNQQRETLLLKLDKEMQQLNGRQEELSKVLDKVGDMEKPEYKEVQGLLESITDKSTRIRATSDSETRGEISAIKKGFDNIGPAFQTALDNKAAAEAEATAAAESRKGMSPP